MEVADKSKLFLAIFYEGYITSPHQKSCCVNGLEGDLFNIPSQGTYRDKMLAE